MSRIIAALETIIPSAISEKSEGDDTRDDHIVPSRSSTAYEDSSASRVALGEIGVASPSTLARHATTGEPLLKTIERTTSRRPPPSPRRPATLPEVSDLPHAVPKPNSQSMYEAQRRLADSNSDDEFDDMPLETIDPPPHEECEDEANGNSHSHSLPTYPAVRIDSLQEQQAVESPDFGNISEIAADEPSVESPDCSTSFEETTTVDGMDDSGSKTTASNTVRRGGSILSDAFSDPSTATEVTSNLTLAAPARNAAMRDEKGSKLRVPTPIWKPKRAQLLTNRKLKKHRRGSQELARPVPLQKVPSLAVTKMNGTGLLEMEADDSEYSHSDSSASRESHGPPEEPDPSLVRYFLGMILTAEGVIAEEASDCESTKLEGNAKRGNDMSKSVKQRSASTKVRDDKRSSLVDVVRDFWRSLACDTLWQSNEDEDDPQAEAAYMLSFDSTFFQELWNEIQVYRESCGSLTDVEDARSMATSTEPGSRKRTETDHSISLTSLGNSLDVSRYAQSEAAGLCMPGGSASGDLARSDVILEQCRQRFPSLYDKLIQKLDDHRSRRKAHKLKRGVHKESGSSRDDSDEDEEFSVHTPTLTDSFNELPPVHPVRAAASPAAIDKTQADPEDRETSLCPVQDVPSCEGETPLATEVSDAAGPDVARANRRAPDWRQIPFDEEGPCRMVQAKVVPAGDSKDLDFDHRWIPLNDSFADEMKLPDAQEPAVLDDNTERVAAALAPFPSVTDDDPPSGGRLYSAAFPPERVELRRCEQRRGPAGDELLPCDSFGVQSSITEERQHHEGFAVVGRSGSPQGMPRIKEHPAFGSWPTDAMSGGPSTLNAEPRQECTVKPGGSLLRNTSTASGKEILADLALLAQIEPVPAVALTLDSPTPLPSEAAWETFGTPTRALFGVPPGHGSPAGLRQDGPHKAPVTQLRSGSWEDFPAAGIDGGSFFRTATAAAPGTGPAVFAAGPMKNAVPFDAPPSTPDASVNRGSSAQAVAPGAPTKRSPRFSLVGRMPSWSAGSSFSSSWAAATASPTMKSREQSPGPRKRGWHLPPLRPSHKAIVAGSSSSPASPSETTAATDSMEWDTFDASASGSASWEKEPAVAAVAVAAAAAGPFGGLPDWNGDHHHQNDVGGATVPTADPLLLPFETGDFAASSPRGPRSGRGVGTGGECLYPPSHAEFEAF